jgi:hypothetical protein
LRASFLRVYIGPIKAICNLIFMPRTPSKARLSYSGAVAINGNFALFLIVDPVIAIRQTLR